MQKSCATVLSRRLRTRNFSSSTSGGGGDVKIVASVLFERLPVVIPKIDPTIYAFQEFSGKGEYQMEYKPAPRVTEADKNNDRRSLNRALDKRLYLLLHGTAYDSPDGDPCWPFPEKVHEAEDNLCSESSQLAIVNFSL